MELTPKRRLRLYAGRATQDLGREIAELLDDELRQVKLVDFASGETYCRYEESVRDTDVFVIQSHVAPVNDAIMEQLIMIDAAKRASAKRIIAVCPYFGYARQDRKALSREPITAKLVADLFGVAGVDRVIGVDLHSGQIQGFFDVPFDHLTAFPVLEDYVADNIDQSNLVVVAPDAGRVKTAERFAHRIGADIAFAHKRRSRSAAHQVEVDEVIGDVDGRHCVIIDDMIDTAGTVCAAAELLHKRGATDCWIMATHGLLSGPAVDRLKNAPISKVVITNSLPLPKERQFDKLEILSVAGVLASAIESVFEGSSVSDLFQGENQL